MGADTFMVTGHGEDPRTAFSAAVRGAQISYGDRGYTGSLAEKSSFIMIPKPRPDMTGREIADYADQLIDDGDPRVDDKWGPAGCIDMGGGKYLFFGWASS